MDETTLSPNRLTTREILLNKPLEQRDMAPKKRKKVPERVFKKATQEDNLNPLATGELRPLKNLARKAEVAAIHRRFIGEILTTQKAEVILTTGKTASQTHNELLAAAYLEGEKAVEKGEKPPDSYPLFMNWPSINYLGKLKEAPNAVVYKVISQKAIEEAQENIELARELKDGQIIKGEMPLEPKAAAAEAIKAVLEGKKMGGAEIEAAVTAFRGLNNQETEELMGQLPKDQQDIFKSRFPFLAAKRDRLWLMAENFGDELEGLAKEIKMMRTLIGAEAYRRTNDGSWEIPTGKDRVTLMKALYPEQLLFLFRDYQKREAKRIALYDDVLQTGGKIRGYSQFFEALDISKQVEAYIVFSRRQVVTGANFSRTHIGKVSSESFMYAGDRDEVNIFGKKHDQAVAFAGYEMTRPPKDFGEIKTQVLKRLRTAYEQMKLPELMESLRPWTEKAAKLRRYDSHFEDLTRAGEFLTFFQAGSPSPLIARDSRGLKPEQMAKFEKEYEVCETHKTLAKFVYRVLREIAETTVGKEESALVCLDEETYVLAKALQETKKEPAGIAKIDIIEGRTEPRKPKLEELKSPCLLGIHWPLQAEIELMFTEGQIDKISEVKVFLGKRKKEQQELGEDWQRLRSDLIKNRDDYKVKEAWPESLAPLTPPEERSQYWADTFWGQLRFKKIDDFNKKIGPALRRVVEKTTLANFLEAQPGFSDQVDLRQEPALLAIVKEINKGYVATFNANLELLEDIPEAITAQGEPTKEFEQWGDKFLEAQQDLQAYYNIGLSPLFSIPDYSKYDALTSIGKEQLERTLSPDRGTYWQGKVKVMAEEKPDYMPIILPLRPDGGTSNEDFTVEIFRDAERLRYLTERAEEE